MTSLLQLNSSLNGARSLSTALADELVAAWQRRHPDGQVVRRDLHAEPIPHLDAARFGAFTTPAGERSGAQADVIAYSDKLIDELRAADLLVLGAPMYNFSIPSTLKAWFDHVARSGETFRYTDKGPVGLLRDKRAIVVATRGGRYVGTPSDSHTPLIRTLLGFLGIEAVEFVYAEGTNMGEKAKQAALQDARETIAQLDLGRIAA